MSGHSKWATTKRQKAATDAKRGKLFTKLANNIIVAVKTGGGPSSETNTKLKAAIEKAKTFSMPAENISRAIQKAQGAESDSAQEVVYEGYGPAGVAIVVEVLTSNRNKTAADIRAAFTKAGGKLGSTGSVAWMFEPVALIAIQKRETESQMLAAIEAGADDVEEADDRILIYTAPAKLHELKQKLEAVGEMVTESGLTRRQKTTVSIEDPKLANQVIALLDTIEDIDEVTETYANYDIPDAVLAGITS